MMSWRYRGVEAPIRIGGQLCPVLLQIYFSICVPKIIKIQCSWAQLLQKKIKWCIFAPQCIYTNHILNRHSKFGEDRMNNAVFWRKILCETSESCNVTAPHVQWWHQFCVTNEVRIVNLIRYSSKLAKIELKNDACIDKRQKLRKPEVSRRARAVTISYTSRRSRPWLKNLLQDNVSRFVYIG